MGVFIFKKWLGTTEVVVEVADVMTMMIVVTVTEVSIFLLFEHYYYEIQPPFLV